MTTVRTLNDIPYVSDIELRPGEHLEILESTGTLAQYVLRKANGKGIYMGLVHTTRRPAETGSNSGSSPGASDVGAVAERLKAETGDNSPTSSIQVTSQDGTASAGSNPADTGYFSARIPFHPQGELE